MQLKIIFVLFILLTQALNFNQTYNLLQKQLYHNYNSLQQSQIWKFKVVSLTSGSLAPRQVFSYDFGGIFKNKY